jgi:spore germination protein KA
VFILAGGIFGLFGITVAGTLFLFRLCSKNAYGVPYMAPFAPFTLKSIIRDTFVRVSWKKLSHTDVTLQQLSGMAKRKTGKED